MKIFLDDFIPSSCRRTKKVRYSTIIEPGHHNSIWVVGFNPDILELAQNKKNLLYIYLILSQIGKRISREKKWKKLKIELS